MQKLILIISMLILSACTTLKNFDNSSLNQKQQEIASQEITNIIVQNYSVKTNPNLGLIIDTEISKIIEQSLRKSGYAVDKPNNKNITVIYTLNKIDENLLLLNLKVDNTKLSKLYQIKANSLISMSPLTIGSK